MIPNPGALAFVITGAICIGVGCVCNYLLFRRGE